MTTKPEALSDEELAEFRRLASSEAQSMVREIARLRRHVAVENEANKAMYVAWQKDKEEVDRLRAENAALQQRVYGHLIMFQSNDETFARYREIIVNNTKLTDELRAENGSLQAEVDKLRHDATCTRVDKLEAENARQAATIAQQAVAIISLRGACQVALKRVDGAEHVNRQLVAEVLREALKESR